MRFTPETVDAETWLTLFDKFAEANEWKTDEQKNDFVLGYLGKGPQIWATNKNFKTFSEFKEGF